MALAELLSWHVLGAGSIGGLWAAHLHQAGRAPVMVLRHDRLAGYQKAQGLHIEGKGLIPVAAVSPAKLAVPIKRLLVCCKSTDTLNALGSIVENIHDNTLIVLVQNGMGTYEQVCQQFPANPILCGTTTQGAYRPTPFHIVPAGEGETLVGSLDRCWPPPIAEIESLSCPGFVTRYAQPILPILWRKLAINCAINPLTVRYQCRNGELLNIPRARTEMAGICAEILAVSRALDRLEGIENLESVVTEVAHQTGANHSSMLQDVRAGRATEIESITGYLCRIAEDHGISTPLNNALYQEILTLQ